VKAYTAVRDHKVHFNQLEKGTGARIKHENVSEKSGHVVDGDDIELGFEVRKGRFVTFEKGELDKLRPESTRTIEVSDFVSLEEIDPIYYQRTYWLAPADDSASKAYQLLLAALEERQRVGIGTVVMRNKQYLAAIRPLDGALAMSTMRFADEVVPQADVDAIPSRRSKPDAKTLKLATQIIDALDAPWDPKRYSDTYTDEVRAIIKRKDKGEEAVVEEKPAETSNVLDLMAALEASVSAAKSRRASGAKKKSTARKATRTSGAKKAGTKRRSSARKSA
jgi:DNA end-binding protein Ku